MSDIVTCSDLWYENARRHVQMASTLLDAGFGDGGYFHLYHALECSASAIIVRRDKTRMVPLDHAEKLARATDLLSTQSADPAAQFTEFLNVLNKRNQSLYVSANGLAPWKRSDMEPRSVRPVIADLTEFLTRLEQLLKASDDQSTEQPEGKPAE
ncbi:MAG: hypothetical protein ACYCW6_09505 [Candidatus Xenobia bacterium]